jgi:hypothetical protein
VGRAGGDEQPANASDPSWALDIVSERPLGTGAAERLLERRYIGVRADESLPANDHVACGGRRSELAGTSSAPAPRYRWWQRFTRFVPSIKPSPGERTVTLPRGCR